MATDPTARFEAVMAGPEHAVDVDEVALLIAAHANPLVSLSEERTRLDALADAVPVHTVDGVMHHLFVDERFGGNSVDYDDPANSYLDVVLRRRLGIPISLAVLASEVGRRAGVGLHVVGMPGHVLIGADGVDGAWWDPFAGGTRLDQEGCVAIHRGVLGLGARLGARDLLPIGPFAIAARMLGNLQRIHHARRDRRSLAWVLQLRSAVPGVPLTDRRLLASTLAADGRFGEAAAALDTLTTLAAEAGDEALAEESAHGATRLRARLN
ncbi:MAG: transglutaminase-like domain-containing protein [Acidimicrobiales bacterium]